MTRATCASQRAAAAAGIALKKDLRRLRRLVWRCALCAGWEDCQARENVTEWIGQAAQQVLDELERLDG